MCTLVDHIMCVLIYIYIYIHNYIYVCLLIEDKKMLLGQLGRILVFTIIFQGLLV